METIKIVRSGIVATSMMTIFSYLASGGKAKNFREPELLCEIFSEKSAAKKCEQPFLSAGWAAHYAMGVCWSGLENYLLRENRMKADLKSGLLFGCSGGLTGILIWNQLFKLSRRPPLTVYPKFYAHLLLAHIVYSLSVVLLYKATCPQAH